MGAFSLIPRFFCDFREQSVSQASHRVGGFGEPAFAAYHDLGGFLDHRDNNQEFFVVDLVAFTDAPLQELTLDSSGPSEFNPSQS